MNNMINLFLKIFAALALLLISPVVILSMVFIYIEDGLPLFFLQDRLGLNKKIFKIYKIRTMFNETPDLGTHEVNEKQYLKIGHFLRKLKIDELPQIFNYIKGDINLIGPRPGLPSQNELLLCRDSYNIYDVTPGISGLSQVLGYDMSNPYLLSKIDKLYIDQKSLRLDIMILIATFYYPFRQKLAIRFKEKISEYKKEKQ